MLDLSLLRPIPILFLAISTGANPGTDDYLSCSFSSSLFSPFHTSQENKKNASTKILKICVKGVLTLIYIWLTFLTDTLAANWVPVKRQKRTKLRYRSLYIVHEGWGVWTSQFPQFTWAGPICGKLCTFPPTVGRQVMWFCPYKVVLVKQYTKIAQCISGRVRLHIAIKSARLSVCRLRTFPTSSGGRMWTNNCHQCPINTHQNDSLAPKGFMIRSLSMTPVGRVL